MLMQTTLRRDRYSDRWSELQEHIRELHSFLSSQSASPTTPAASATTSVTTPSNTGLANERRQLLDAYLHRLRSNTAQLQLTLPHMPPHPLPLLTHDAYLPLRVTLANTNATPHNLFAVLREQHHLILVGPSGAGKTTTINQLAGIMAAAISDGEQSQWMQRLEGWNRGLRLPVRVQVSQAVAHYTGAPLDALWAAVPELAQGHLTRHERTLLQSTLAYTLERGQGILLLDGLDALLDGPQRDAAQQILEAARARYAASFILAAYRGDDADTVAVQHANWASALLAPLTLDQIDALIDRWYDALAQRGHYQAAVAQERTRKLCATVRANQQLAELASRPQGLTAIVVVHADGNQLPPALVKQVWQGVLAAPTKP